MPLLASITLLQGELVHVDVPDYPGAVATSDYGSMLLVPPTDGTPWRPEYAAEPDAYDGQDVIDAVGAQPWHDEGFDGTGVKIAVFDSQWIGAELRPDELGNFTTHDCAASRACDLPFDTLRPRYASEGGSHGVACAEVIHDLAPGAELHLVRVNGLTTLDNAADWAVREGIDVVSMSVSFFNESFYDGTGPINEAVDRMAAGGVLMVKSAGNYATEHYQATFDDLDHDDRHDFPWGSELLPIDIGATANATIYLNWDQHWSCGTTDLNMYLYDAAGSLVGRSENVQDPDSDNCAPLERISFEPDAAGWYYLMIYRAAGDPDVLFDLYARDNSVYAPMAAGSIVDPATNPLAFTVGAVRANGYAMNNVEYFSSQGPTNAGYPKPEIAGPDGLSSSVYGTTGFYGTSASTPAVAGTLAVLLSSDPKLNSFDAARMLQERAIGMDATWEAPDPAIGAGRAHLWNPTEGSVAHGCATHGSAMLPWWALPWILVPLSQRRRRSPSH